MPCMPSSSAAGKKRRNRTAERYIERSRRGAERVAKDPETWRRLEQADTGEHLTQREFTKRFLSE